MNKIILVISILLYYSCSVPNRTNAIKVDNDSIEPQNLTEYNSVFKNMISDGFTGVLLIAENGKTVYSNAFGQINLEDSISINENSVFELASVSKQFTAAAIAILEQENKINQSDSIVKYLPKLEQYKNIQIKNLIHHTSGLAEYDEGNWTYDRSSFITNDSIINYLAKKKPPLKFETGSKYEYSNTGYVLLASIIESVSGLTFAEFLDKKIFVPAGMQSTQIYRPRYKPENIENYAVGFVYSDSLSKNIIPDQHPEHDYIIHLDGIQGDGMVNSTILDMLKWDRILYSDLIFNSETKRKLFTAYDISQETSTNYGYGWRISKDEKFGKIVNHSGGWPGYVTFIERHLDNDKTIIILQNNYNNYRFPTKSIRSILYRDQIQIPEIGKLVGKYEFKDDKTVLTINSVNSKLIGEYDGDKFGLIPIGENVLFIENQQEVEIEFIEDIGGHISNAKWHQGDYIGELKKIE